MITIIADTTSCLTLEETSRLGIPFLPQYIIFGDEQYRDDTELNSDKFLEKLKKSPILPKTAAPEPSLYTPIYDEQAKAGNSMIVLCPSTDLSGTFRGASIAAKDFPDADIHILDTRSIGSGFGELVLFAYQLAKNGNDIQTIIQSVKTMSNRENLYFLVDTLEYLYKGGRIGGAKALFGSILQVKPLLQLINGRIEAVENLRTKHKAISHLKKVVYKDCPHDDSAHLTVMHGGNEVEAKQFADELSSNLGISRIPINYLPPAIMVHGGPGLLAVSYFKKEL